MSHDSRRQFLFKSGLGVGGAALGGFIPGVGTLQAASAAELADPLAPKDPHFPAKVQSVIDTVAGVGNSVVAKFKSLLGIQSPSRVFAGFGGDLVAGLRVGIDTNGADAAMTSAT